MLGKLMKYDMRSGFRKFALIWIGLAALGVINGFTVKYVLDGEKQNQLVNFFLGVLPMMLLVALYVAMGIFVLVFIVERFYKGLLGDEGYLMFTLPVTTSAHIGSKLLTGMIYVKDSVPDEWDKGSANNGILTINNGIGGLIRTLNDIANCLMERGEINPLKDTPDHMAKAAEYSVSGNPGRRIP